VVERFLFWGAVAALLLVYWEVRLLLWMLLQRHLKLLSRRQRPSL